MCFMVLLVHVRWSVHECVRVCEHAHALAPAHACDQNVQFFASVSFSVTTRDRGFILGIHLHLGKAIRNQ